MNYIVNLKWDNESNVWIATSEDIKGLVLESGSIDALIERVKINAPILLKLNNQLKSDIVFIDFKLERLEKVYA